MKLRKLKRAFQRLTPEGRHLVIGVPFIWLFLFFMLPFFIVLKISFAEADVAIPPYTEIYSYVEDKIQLVLNLANYGLLTEDELYISAYLGSLKMAFFSTLLCLLIGYPMAYAIANAKKETQTVLLLLIMMPTWTAILIRVYAWMGILSNNGLLNGFLMWTGLIDQPLQILNTNLAVYIGVVYSYLPFMILPLYSNLEKHDNTLLEAAQDLGAGPIRAFLRVTLPLSFPGVVAGSLLVFIPAVGEYVVAKLLSDEFFLNRDWPKASAVAIAMLLLLVVPIMVFQRFQNKELQAQKK
jgi:putrescine transport system permease protein